MGSLEEPGKAGYEDQKQRMGADIRGFFQRKKIKFVMIHELSLSRTRENARVEYRNIKKSIILFVT